MLPGFLRWLLAALLSSLGAEQASLSCGPLYIEALTTRQEDVNKIEDRVLWYPNFGRASINFAVVCLLEALYKIQSPRGT